MKIKENKILKKISLLKWFYDVWLVNFSGGEVNQPEKNKTK